MSFYIYTRKNKFQNASKLKNNISKIIFEFFKLMYSHSNIYFHRVNSIIVTSLYRENGKGPHKLNKAVDIVIDPPEYMLYYGAMIYALYPYNVFFGTEKNNDKNLHIHIDTDKTRRSNIKAIEKPNNNKDLISINEKTINYLMNLYNWDFLDSIQNFGKFEKETKELLLTKYPKNSKLSMKDFISIPFEKIIKDKGEIVINKVSSTFKSLFLYTGLITAAYFMYKKYSIEQKSNE